MRRGPLRVTVRDDGRGIAREAIERVLEPGVGRGHGARARQREPPPDRALRRGRAAALVPVRHGRAARGARAMIRALIVDDEAPARSELRYLLQAHPDVAVVGEAASAAEAIALAREPAYDVVFLDVEMPGAVRARDGAAPARAARSACGRLRHGARRVRRRRVRRRGVRLPAEAGRPRPARARRRAAPRALARERRPVEKIPVVAGGGTELLDSDQIHYVQADGDYSRVHTYDRSYLCTRRSASSKTGSAPRFARIHRSHLVNLAKVAGVRRAGPTGSPPSRRRGTHRARRRAAPVARAPRAASA